MLFLDLTFGRWGLDGSNFTHAIGLICSFWILHPINCGNEEENLEFARWSHDSCWTRAHCLQNYSLLKDFGPPIFWFKFHKVRLLSTKIRDCRAVQKSALCRSRRELSNAYLLAKFGFDTAEDEPCQVCQSPFESLPTTHEQLREVRHPSRIWEARSVSRRPCTASLAPSGTTGN